MCGKDIVIFMLGGPIGAKWVAGDSDWRVEKEEEGMFICSHQWLSIFPNSLMYLGGHLTSSSVNNVYVLGAPVQFSFQSC